MHCKFQLLQIIPPRYSSKREERLHFHLNPLVFVVGELQSHFLLHLQAKHNLETFTAPSFSEDTENGEGKNM